MKLELERVGKSYGHQRVLDGVSLTVEHGSRLALVGPNGSGKSTLLRIVMGLVRCEGEVRLDGRSPFDTRHRLARRLAYVPQVAPQLGASVGEVVRAVAQLRGMEPARVAAAAERLGLSMDAVARKPFRALSGGMKQKMLLAMAFSSEATLLILDEPTASLDESSRGAFAELLDESARGATVILCSHRLDEVECATERVVELVEGHVARDLAAVRGCHEGRSSRRMRGGHR